MRQGTWLFLGAIANGGLGFLFWTVAARSFPAEDIGLAATIITLATLATSVGIMGLDSGLIRFIHNVRRPRLLLGQLILLVGAVAGLAGFVLAVSVLQVGEVTGSIIVSLSVLASVVAVGFVWLQLTDAAFLSAERAELATYRAVAFGIGKIVLVLTLISLSVVGLMLAYVLPLLVVLAFSFIALWWLWPAAQPNGVPQRLGNLASFSAGNWASAFLMSLPNRLAPSVVFLFLGPEPVAFFFIAMVLAEAIHQLPESIGKSLFAYGSQVGRFSQSVKKSVGRSLILMVVALVALGVVFAPLAMDIVGGTDYALHAVALQLFVLAVLPRSAIQVLRAQFNVQRRILHLVILGGVTGVSTVAALLIGLALQWPVDFLPFSWILGGSFGLAVGIGLSRRHPSEFKQG